MIPVLLGVTSTVPELPVPVKPPSIENVNTLDTAYPVVHVPGEIEEDNGPRACEVSLIVVVAVVVVHCPTTR